nr:D-alanine--D-alanine ligase-like [Pocillopora verrucosa]
MKKTVKILHVLGSPSDKFSFKLNMLYGGSFHEEMQSPKYDYHFVYALVRPAGSWSFAERLSDIVDLTKLEERGNSLKKVDITAALQHIKHVIQPDMALLHFVCLKGMRTYRALFDALDIPLVGGSVESRYLSMDKLITRGVLVSYGDVSCPDGFIYQKGDPIESEQVRYPCVVKASQGEDTKAVRLVKDSKLLNAAIEHALSYSDHVIIESYIEGREIRCAVVESAANGELKALSCIEYKVRENDIRRTEDKLSCNEKGLPVGKSPENKPWFLDPSKEEKLIHRIQQQSCRAFRELGLQDFGLFDFRVDIEGNPFFLECNLFCSFGPQSVVNIVAKDSGFTDESLFDMMVENTLLRKRKQENNNVNL